MASRFNKTDRLTLTDLWRLQVVTHRPGTHIKRGEGVRRGSCFGHLRGRGRGRERARGRAGRIKAIRSPCFIRFVFQNEENIKKQEKRGKGRMKEIETKTVGVRPVEIKRNMEVRKEYTVYGDALFVTPVCWMKTGRL